MRSKRGNTKPFPQCHVISDTGICHLLDDKLECHVLRDTGREVSA